MTSMLRAMGAQVSLVSKHPVGEQDRAGDRALLITVAAVSVVALTATVWIAFRELGWQPMARAGATLLLTGLVFWTEPVQRALFLGQVELVLMALVVWDLCQPDRRWWKG